MGAPTAKLETVVIFSPYKALSLFFDILAVLILLITIPTSFWFHMDSTTRYGLWIECITVRIENNLTTTAEISSDLSSTTRSYIVKSFDCSLYNKVWIQICGGLVVVAFLCGIIGIVLSGLGFSHKKRQERKMKYYSAAIFVYVVGGVCLLVSLTVFPLMFLRESHFRGKDKWYFGWSYGVAWGATIFLFGAALLMMCDRNREEIFYRERLYLNQDDDDNVEANQEAKIKTLR